MGHPSGEKQPAAAGNGQDINDCLGVAPTVGRTLAPGFVLVKGDGGSENGEVKDLAHVRKEGIQKAHRRLLFFMKPFPSHLPHTRFRHVDRWKEHGGDVLLLPAIWLQPNAEKGLSVRYHVLTLGFLRFRIRWTWGVHCSRTDRLPTWKQAGGDAFLAWAHTTYGGEWPRSEAQKFFRQNPKWHPLVALGGLDIHYIRVLLAREMMRLQDQGDQGESQLSDLEASAGFP